MEAWRCVVHDGHCALMWPWALGLGFLDFEHPSFGCWLKYVCCHRCHMTGWFVGDTTTGQLPVNHALDLSFGALSASFGVNATISAFNYGLFYRSKTLVSSTRVSCYDHRKSPVDIEGCR